MGLYRDNGKQNGNYYLGFRVSAWRRPMINKPSPLKGLNVRIPIIIPMKGRGSVNQGSGLQGI